MQNERSSWRPCYEGSLRGGCWLLVITMNLKLMVESELAELALDGRMEYLKSLGVNESGLGNLIRTTYVLLGLRTYFTPGEKETIMLGGDSFGMTAPQAAGVIQSERLLMMILLLLDHLQLQEHFAELTFIYTIKKVYPSSTLDQSH
ncbi:PREDICTED: uncharacterized protein LOC109162761 [Ipomoea nil]|uniref:uncharacterized protein LOC109162761 n=1 Tax=Ipomoea nil TaxID=35883 RepID=UPI0009012269|nr:PREDICTED: uncharacterized protein LOC109162761 [Ipomoea nil]